LRLALVELLEPGAGAGAGAGAAHLAHRLRLAAEGAAAADRTGERFGDHRERGHRNHHAGQEFFHGHHLKV
jgi:hypothetical protein